MMSASTVILYGFAGPEGKKIKTLCARMGLRLRQVRPEEAGQPVGAFAGAAAFQETAESVEMPGEMMVLAGLTDRQIEVFLSGLRTARVARGTLKAVLTPTNRSWTSAQLYQELCREHEAMQAGRRADHGQP